MSERSDIAERLAQIVRDNRMCSPFGGDVNRSRDGRSYGFAFSRPRTLDGCVEVYGPRFILIQMQGPGSPGHGFNAVYGSEEHARSVLEAVARHDNNAALEVPVRVTRT